MTNLRLYLTIGDHMALFPPYRWETEPMNLRGTGRIRECGIAWLCFSLEWYKHVPEEARWTTG